MRGLYIFLIFSCSLPVYAKWDGYCFEDASARSGINKDLLVAIASTESNIDPGVVNKNRDGTEDIGVMQINSRHLPMLRTAGIKRDDLFKPCINIHVGAFILRDCIQSNGDTWRAVGAYNAGYAKTARAERNRRSYAMKVKRNYERIRRSKGVV